MAPLPPKIPHQIWPPPTASPPPMWSEDYSSARRGTHRRSMSDSIADIGGGGFDRLDDQQLFSMLTDDVISVGVAVGPASTPVSDQNSKNDDNNNNGNGDSPMQINPTLDHSHSDPTDFDPKRVKRVLANRQSAQRSRVRKLQYISELERGVTSLQTEVSALSPRVAYLDHQRLIMNLDNGALKQRLAALAQDKIFKDAYQEALHKEIERLRQIYHHQQQNMKIQPSSSDPNNNTDSRETEQVLV